MSFLNWLGKKHPDYAAMDPIGDNSNMPTQMQAMWPPGTEVAIKSKMGVMTGVIKSVDPIKQTAIVLDDNQRPIEVPVTMLRARR